MHGVVGCETLYPELPRLVQDGVIRYVPQWYHEFPIHAPDSETSHALLQARIEEVESREVDDVVVIYGDPGALTGLRTRSVPLHVARGADCIGLHLDTEPNGQEEESRDRATYYLTRGWIDVGIDCFKVHEAYAGRLEALLERFERAKRTNPGMRVSWPESEHIQQAASRSSSLRTDPGDILRPVIGGYEHVVLVDTGRLNPFHHAYAESFRGFLDEVGSEDPHREVSLTVTERTLDRLHSIVRTPATRSDVISLEPEEPVPEGLTPHTGPQHPPEDA